MPTDLSSHNDGTHRLYKATLQGHTHLPAWSLTRAETLPIRHRLGARPRHAGGAHPGAREPAMTEITVSIWHNMARDPAGRPTAQLDGLTPGDPMVRVFTYHAPADGRLPEAIAEDAFALASGHPRDPASAELSRRYYERRLRSVQVADLVVAGEAALTVERAGWPHHRSPHQ